MTISGAVFDFFEYTQHQLFFLSGGVVPDSTAKHPHGARAWSLKLLNQSHCSSASQRLLGVCGGQGVRHVPLVGVCFGIIWSIQAPTPNHSEHHCWALMALSASETAWATTCIQAVVGCGDFVKGVSPLSVQCGRLVHATKTCAS